MLERKTSSDTEISVNYKKYGVVLFIFGESGNVLVLKEKTSNPENEKLAGNLSVLCETSETGENWKEIRHSPPGLSIRRRGWVPPTARDTCEQPGRR